MNIKLAYRQDWVALRFPKDAKKKDIKRIMNTIGNRILPKNKRWACWNKYGEFVAGGFF